MEKEVFKKELAMCRELYLKNGGYCNWGKCGTCGVVPLLYKLGEGKIYEDKDEIKKIKKDTLE
ncbi:hypothetical protein COT98_01355 [Candidatus Falkowbacteria bacterium CG10_big_fil_rev_8_21_14_0_10_39_9]|uniref:Uncharacterized protein n=1 Tax=Candidatus Falkowbacteria bacterium CG10_big_fil_rev_8_21_14_0_10_39_9 TaxID=1974566 RepID=A0A2M6WQF5_9BACT|nr:MAG: hypothetical protein COT98_01355 [Candidatus Falkowbacteria bacterium CG10_big_fil_rev_8_21_14_0_10_39_9]